MIWIWVPSIAPAQLGNFHFSWKLDITFFWMSSSWGHWPKREKTFVQIGLQAFCTTQQTVDMWIPETTSGTMFPGSILTRLQSTQCSVVRASPFGLHLYWMDEAFNIYGETWHSKWVHRRLGPSASPTNHFYIVVMSQYRIPLLVWIVYVSANVCIAP